MNTHAKWAVGIGAGALATAAIIAFATKSASAAAPPALPAPTTPPVPMIAGHRYQFVQTPYTGLYGASPTTATLQALVAASPFASVWTVQSASLVGTTFTLIMDVTGGGTTESSIGTFTGIAPGVTITDLGPIPASP